MDADVAVAAALEVAEVGMRAGELPIGAAVFHGDELVASAHTREKALGRRIVHADLLAMIAADEELGWRRRSGEIGLAVTLEPCVMCIGAAMVLGVSDVYFALDSPADGGSHIAESWPTHPTMPWFTGPRIHRGVRKQEVREQFQRYLQISAADSSFRTWAESVLELNSP